MTSHQDHPSGEGLLVVLSGPSGVGKTTIVGAVKDRLNGMFSVSATTRPATAQDRAGESYLFVDETRFQEMVDAGEFLEHAQVFGRHRYGTPRGPVENALTAGRLVLLEIDVQGAMQVRENMPDAFMVFILPPSEAALLERLRARGRDDEAEIQRRFEEATREIALAKSEGVYDAFVVNDDLEAAVNEACGLIQGRLERVA